MGEIIDTTAPARDRWLYLILLLALALRTYHLAYPPWDYHNWRQTHTLMVARHFARQGFPVLHPQVQWVSGDAPSRPTYHSGEFSIQGVLAALLYRVFGESDAAARLVVIAFSLLGTYSLYLLMSRHAGRLAGHLAALIYALLPCHLFFGRVFMPDVPAISLALAGLESLDRWAGGQRRSRLFAAALFTALGILQKLTVVIVAAPMLYLFWTRYGRKVLSRPEIYIFGISVGFPAVAWYAHAHALGRLSDGIIMPVRNIGKHLELWLGPAFFGEVLRRSAGEAFTPLGLALAVVGLFWPGQSRVGWIFRLWLIAAAALLFVVPNTLAENYYYLVLLAPAIAGLAGLILASWVPDPRSHRLLALLLVFFAVDALRCALPLYKIDRAPSDLGILLNRLTKPEDLIVTGSGGSPNVLYAADRRGWMGTAYDLANLERLAQKGASYYACAFQPTVEDRRGLLPGLDLRFQRLTAEDAYWTIYFLGAPTGLLKASSPGEIQKPHPANFANQIQLLGLGLRELLSWPTSYEVTYHWQCLKSMDADFRAFVQVINEDGNAVFQQDHWPLSGHLPTTRWKVGDVIRERYVVVAPNWLPEGKYQIWAGWYDPTSGRRLPIIDTSSSVEMDRTRLGEIEVHRPPRYGWFSVKY